MLLVVAQVAVAAVTMCSCVGCHTGLAKEARGQPRQPTSTPPTPMPTPAPSAQRRPTCPPKKSKASRRRLPTVQVRPASIGVMSSFRSLPAQACRGRGGGGGGGEGRRGGPSRGWQGVRLAGATARGVKRQASPAPPPRMACARPKPAQAPPYRRTTTTTARRRGRRPRRTVQAEAGLEAEGVAGSQAAQPHPPVSHQRLCELHGPVAGDGQLKAVLAGVPAV